MSGLDRRTLLKLAGGTGVAGLNALAGCTGGGGGGQAQETTTTTTTDAQGTTTTTTTGDPVNIGMVYALGGLGDKSFNDMANKGVKRAKSELGVKYTNAEPGSQSEIETLQRKFAQSTSPTYELVVTVGFVQATPLKKNADRYPDQKWTIIDSVVEKDNVASYVFKEHQGSFQVGYLAGLMTTKDFSAGAGSTNDDTVVGFVGGKQIPLIQKFQAGYMAGVKHADSDITIRSAYAGAWNDPATGKAIANSMYSEGADIVYHAAGGTGIGVFKAAQESGRYAIGVDSDQSRSAPEFANVILASMVKHVDVAVFESVENVVNGTFKGSVHRLGLQKNGVEAVLGQQLGSAIPSSVTDKLETSRQAIVSGEISVPTNPDAV
ncbi:MAG: BMP family protein [Halodesulfurarchaeum sp.]